MKVADLLKDGFIIAELKNTGKNEVINELIELFKDDPRVDDLDKVKEAVLERENEILGAFGKSTKAIDYQSLDQQPVHLVFLLVGKDNLVSTHIKLLSRISRMMNKDEFRNSLIGAKSEEEILHLFRKEEENYFEV